MCFSKGVYFLILISNFGRILDYTIRELICIKFKEFWTFPENNLNPPPSPVEDINIFEVASQKYFQNLPWPVILLFFCINFPGNPRFFPRNFLCTPWNSNELHPWYFLLIYWYIQRTNSLYIELTPFISKIGIFYGQQWRKHLCVTKILSVICLCRVKKRTSLVFRITSYNYLL